MRTRTGLTLVEVLVAAAVLLLLLGLLGSLIRGAGDVYRTTDEIASREDRLDAVANVVRYDLRLAGYRGADGDGTLPGGGPRVEAPSDQLIVRYVEDRYGSGTTPLEIAYRVRDGALERRVGTSAGGGTFEPFLLSGVERFAARHDDEGATMTLSFGGGRPDLTIAATFAQPEAGE